jgi:hypothetical protein
MQQSLDLFHTTNIKLAAALVTLGWNLYEAEPVTRLVNDDNTETTRFFFHSRHPESGHSAFDIFQKFDKQAEVFNSTDPEHPLNYIRAALFNRDELVGLVKRTARLVTISRNGKRIAISERADDETKKKFARFLS